MQMTRIKIYKMITKTCNTKHSVKKLQSNGNKTGDIKYNSKIL